MDLQTEGTTVFMGGIFLRMLNMCIKFLETHIPEGQSKWFIDMAVYLEFFIG